MPSGLPKPVATLARCLLSLMPTEQASPVSAAIWARIVSASATGSATCGTDVGLVPAPDLHRVAEVAQHPHHLIGGLVVGGWVRGQKRRIRAAPRRAAQRHSGVHAELARLIGRARHDLARLGRIAAAADDHRQADEFGVAAQLNGGQELIEVHVQDPVAGLGRAHFPHSLRATLSQASPSVSRVRPRSTS